MKSLLTVLSRCVLVIAVCVASSVTTRAQDPTVATPEVPKWEAISIHPCNSESVRPTAGARAGYVNATPGRLHVQCMWLEYLVQMAYVQHADLNRSAWTKASSAPITGGPGWIKSELYTIEATAPGVTNQRMLLGPMLQALLEERFRLKLRRDVRDIPVYELHVAAAGFKLQPLPEGSCIPMSQAPTIGSPEWKGVGGSRVCGNARGGRRGPQISLNLTGNSLADLAAHLELDRLVVDKTGIPGLFDVSLTFGKDDTTAAMFPSPQIDSAVEDPTGGPSIFTAVQEQLGLRLVPAQGKGVVFTIESVERPTEN